MGHKGSVTTGDRIVSLHRPPPIPEEVLADKIVSEMSWEKGGVFVGIFEDTDLPYVVRLPDHGPIRPGSVRLYIEGVDFLTPNIDNGNGWLLGTKNLNGTINYCNGELKLYVTSRAYGKSIYAYYALDFEAAPDLPAPEKSKLSKLVTSVRKYWGS